MRHKLVCKITFKSGKQICPWKVVEEDSDSSFEKDCLLDTFDRVLTRNQRMFDLDLGDYYIILTDEIAAFGIGVYPYKEDTEAAS